MSDANPCKLSPLLMEHVAQTAVVTGASDNAHEVFILLCEQAWEEGYAAGLHKAEELTAKLMGALL